MTASPVPEDELPESGPAFPDGVAEIPHRSDTPAKIGSLPGDRYPTPQPEEAGHAKSSHRAKKRKLQKEGQEVAELQRPPAPTPDNTGLATEPGGAKVISSKVSGGGSNPAEKEIIDLTIKEESRSATPTFPAQANELNRDPVGLNAGWVCASGIVYHRGLTRNQGPFLPLNDIAGSTDIKKPYSTIGVVMHARNVTETRTGGI
jgi:hypothetical protein